MRRVYESDVYKRTIQLQRREQAVARVRARCPATSFLPVLPPPQAQAQRQTEEVRFAGPCERWVSSVVVTKSAPGVYETCFG